ncbi:MAG: hypothetical protein J7K40_10135 [candidate division Zixibacteria bacterium]|nr:hypothetical protein [candidate division Zixibacteria bacterium]
MGKAIKITKNEIITKIFKHCKAKRSYIFDNELVKDIIKKSGSKTNPYDMTKLDDTSRFPEILRKKIILLLI